MEVTPLAFEVGSRIMTPVISGAINGAVYGLLGLGLVLLYKGNRIFNFAQGEFGTVAAFATFAGVTGYGAMPKVPYVAAAAFGVAMAILVALLTERLVVRPLFRQPKVTLVVATAGVALMLIAIEGFIFGAEPSSLPPALEGPLFTSGGLRVTKQGLLIVIVLGVLAGASALFFSKTRTGTAILAVSMEPTATSLVGISVNRISALTWGMAGLLGGVGGILFAGNVGLLGPGALTGLALIPAFTAAVFGGITSLPGAFLGGVVIGIIQALGQRNIPESVVPSANQVVVFFVLLLVLLFRPGGLLGKET
ncbi:MAG TPA: branched-chain amino acid ABC transporter permease [Mycobacteriales bacterium]|nr:branched-chain amino acid ABC transporter permease [Mycobacteriales bacterium]